MASDSGRDRGQTCPHSGGRSGAGDEEENPFISFRRYADKQLSTLLRSVVGLPSAVLPPAKDWLGLSDEALSQELRARRDSANNDYCQHHKCRDCNPSDGYPSSRGGCDEQFFGTNPSKTEQHRRYTSQSIPASAFDTLFDSSWPTDPSFLFRDLAHFHRPFIFDFMSPSTSAGWPISYLMFSPYSPLQLERQRQLRPQYQEHASSSWFDSLAPSHEHRDLREPQWREAFEDLLRIENGKAMLDRHPQGERTSESGKSWLAGLIQRGSLGDGWSHVSQPDGEGEYFKFQRITSNDTSSDHEGMSQGKVPSEEGEQFSELDLYDNFLHKVSHGAAVSQTSPLLRAILEERKQKRQELEELQLQWREMFREKEMERAEDHQAIADSACFRDTASQSQTNENLSPPIVSSVTTTQRQMQPDGSIKTKTVVSRRFADGREENTETEEITRNNRIAVEDSNQAIATTQDENDSGTPNGRDKKRSGGWFWQE
ncbi:hypothetical protein GTR04_5349 [Trichophyton interdigitale]|uniref:Uncharacterized protein n=1 Tax=Trichophyton interdigitale TaxID=101480 RepID=A0A9P5D0J4_9EURO|nr:hypothetical protein GY631_4049 [Trichophyton interdigitale]KAF3901034.1 hypothetical protein GY632_0268 [Trichophyton interdigitale]KAG8207283.1 hypothetical protein GTR04_5349 [Trichophyton interdigitale]